MDMAISTMNKVFNSQPFRTPLHVSSRGHRLLAGVLNYGMLAVLALTLAYWIWQLAAPAALPAVATKPLINREAVATITARHWFGGNNTGLPGASPENALNIKLVGIFGAAKSKKQAGFAIFQLKDGKQVYASPRAVAAYMTQINTVDLTRRSPSYENRLSKYSHRGFEVYWPLLDRSRIDPTIFERSFGRTVGLARLLVLEKLPSTTEREAYVDQRRAERGR